MLTRSPLREVKVAPIPSATLPGLKLLYDRALLALERCQETQSIDFKQAADWESLKWRITETALGMGNLRDGGVIIIGVSENGDSWELTGISENDLRTFDVDIMIDQVNSYTSPHVNLTLASGRNFSIANLASFERDLQLLRRG